MDQQHSYQIMLNTPTHTLLIPVMLASASTFAGSGFSSIWFEGILLEIVSVEYDIIKIVFVIINCKLSSGSNRVN